MMTTLQHYHQILKKQNNHFLRNQHLITETMDRKIHHNTLETPFCVSMETFSTIKPLTVSKSNAIKCSIYLPPTSFEENKFIENPPFATLYQKDMFTQLCKLEKSEEFMKETLLTWG